MKLGAPGWTGPLGERMDCSAPSVVDDKGDVQGSFHSMHEFFPDTGDRNPYKRSAQLEDIHAQWAEWATTNR